MKRIMLAGTCASGTTALAKCFLQRPDTLVFSQVLKSYVERGEEIDYDAFYGRRGYSHGLLFDKETFGYRNAELCEFQVFEDSHLSDPDNFFIFLFRNPVGV